LISFEVDKPRIREDNSGLAIVPEELSLLGKYYGRMEPSYPGNFVQKGTILLRINIKESSQQQKEEISEEKVAATTTLNTLHQTNWPHLRGNDT